MVAEWCQPRWSPTVRRASAADIGCGAIVVIPKYQPQRRLQIWIPSRGTCKNLTNKEPPPKFNVVFRPGKWVSALHRSLWGANDDIWGHSSLWKSGVNIIQGTPFKTPSQLWILYPLSTLSLVLYGFIILYHFFLSTVQPHFWASFLHAADPLQFTDPCWIWQGLDDSIKNAQRIMGTYDQQATRCGRHVRW